MRPRTSRWCSSDPTGRRPEAQRGRGMPAGRPWPRRWTRASSILRASLKHWSTGNRAKLLLSGLGLGEWRHRQGAAVLDRASRHVHLVPACHGALEEEFAGWTKRGLLPILMPVDFRVTVL